MYSWYLVQTQPRREFVAQEGLAGQGYDVFIPCIWKTVRHARKIANVKAALFPGYLFAGFDPALTRWRTIDGTRGVVRLVKAGDTPLAAPAGLVETLKSASDADGMFQARPEALEPGDRVRILSGPFEEHLAVVDTLSGGDRVKLLLRLMEATVRVDMPRAAVRVVH